MRRGEILSLDSRGFHRLRYQEWGSADNERVVICVHGLARNSRDFDDLAQALSRVYRVICPDLPGRGESDWLENPDDYALEQYVQDMVTLIARLNVKGLDWIGTSLGGLIGMVLASRTQTPIRRLVLNDIGPFVPREALARISGYLGDHRFADLAELEQWMRHTYPALDRLEDRQWHHLLQHAWRRCEDDHLALHYDPAIAHNAARAAHQDLDLWPLWQQIRCPRLLLHGATSDVLTSAVVARMEAECDNLSTCTFPGVGHAPSLMESEQIALVTRWLRSTR